mmetsp:Transcript_31397/g.57664  ORF Transcript_31397/g.57664 Transcript_31397/m.57664 type:complete len:240 (+) Transcript_31397:70-789(+)
MFLFRASLLLYALTSAQAARVSHASRDRDARDNPYWDLGPHLAKFHKGMNFTMQGYTDDLCTEKDDSASMYIELVDMQPGLCVLVERSKAATEPFLVETWMEGGVRRSKYYEPRLYEGEAKKCDHNASHTGFTREWASDEQIEQMQLIVQSLFGKCQDARGLGWGYLKLDVAILEKGDGPYYQSGLFVDKDEEDVGNDEVATTTSTKCHCDCSKNGAKVGSPLHGVAWLGFVLWWLCHR